MISLATISLCLGFGRGKAFLADPPYDLRFAKDQLQRNYKTMYGKEIRQSSEKGDYCSLESLFDRISDGERYEDSVSIAL